MPDIDQSISENTNKVCLCYRPYSIGPQVDNSLAIYSAQGAKNPGRPCNS